MADKLGTFKSYLERLKTDLGDTLDHFNNLTDDQAASVCETVGASGLVSALQHVQELRATILQKEAEDSSEEKCDILQQDIDQVTSYINHLNGEKVRLERNEILESDENALSLTEYEEEYESNDEYSGRRDTYRHPGPTVPRWEDSDEEIESDSDVECSEMELPTLLTQIRKILDEYPDDGQIIKELVQNADDAQAKEMKILFDGRDLHGSPKSANRYNKFFKAPALVVFNDGEFTSEDWIGIKRVYNSVKADDPLRVGRFGLGFKSVFHITDNPCIISGEKILFMNPLSKNSSQVCVTISLKRLEHIKRLNINDFLESFEGIFGMDRETLRHGHYKGTMFRFPLRQEESSLSTNLYNESKILDLFRALHSDSNRNMLFLRNVQSLSLYLDLPNSSSSTSSSHLSSESSSLYNLSVEQINLGIKQPFYTVDIKQKDIQALTNKARFEETIRNTGLSVADQSSYFTSHATVHTVLSLSNGSRKDMKVDWFIINYLHGGKVSEELKTLLQDESLGYLPIAGIATKLNTEGWNESVGDNGNIFCYQPLPQDKDSHTGLPVHVNAYFALTQNRRHVKWPTEEQEIHQMHTDSAIRWNKTIVREILPQAYALFIKELIELCKQEGNVQIMVQTVYDKFPDISKTSERWQIVTENTIEIVKSMNLCILFTHNAGGQWISSRQAILASFTQSQTDDCDISDIIVRLLLKDDINVVCAPDHITCIGHGSRVISPSLLCDHLKNHKTYKSLEPEQKLCILEYMCQNNDIEDLQQIELVPLQNSGFISLEEKAEVFVCEEEIIKLFPSQEGAFIATNIPIPVRNYFRQFSESGSSVLKKLDAKATAEMVKRTLSSHFEETIPICMSESEYKDWEAWLMQIWNHLYENHEHSFDQFIHLPLMPIHTEKSGSCDTIKLHPLTDKLILKTQDGGYVLPEDVCEALKCFSVTVIVEKPDWIQMNLSQYLYNISNTSLNNIIEKISGKDIESFNTNLMAETRKVFLEFLVENLRTVSEDAKKVLRKLNMFEQFVSHTSDAPVMICLEDRNEVYQETEFPVKFPNPLIKLSSYECDLAMKIGAQEITQSDLILKAFEVFHTPLYSQEEQKVFILWLLKSGLWNKYEKISHFLKNLSYLQAADGSLHSPKELFDPSDDKLNKLFMFEPKFPTDNDFLTEECCYALRKLGLKQECDVSTADIEQTCKLIDTKSAEGNIELSNKAHAVLELLEKRVDLLRHAGIRDLRFIPVVKNRPSSYPSCLSFKAEVYTTTEAPSNVTSSQHNKLIGSVLATVECQQFPLLAEHYGWCKTPSLENIVHHLHNLIKSYTSQDKPEVMSLITDIYTVLAKTYSFEDTKRVLKMTFPDRKFIWFGDGFDAPECLYIERHPEDLEMKPFLRPLPSELTHLKNFFHGLECFEHVNAEAYLFVLKQLKENTDRGSFPTSAVVMRNISVSILNILQKKIIDYPLCTAECIYVPIQKRDDSLQFKSAGDCVYCDASWLKEELNDDAGDAEDEELFFSHEDILLATAEALGIPSLSKKVFADSDAMEEWGQEEPLTRRLKTILEEGYVDGFSIPKELFQNADDAGATKMWMLYDERENQDCKKNLLSAGMSEWQGPALWVYNDAKFTEEDFKNLTKLSGATKESDPCTIGKFGLGFCAVYNLTDVPSLISGENIVIFDPHMKYLGSALPGKSPGLRLNLPKVRSQALRKKVCNQFRLAENIFGCQNISEEDFHFEGTLFRFPLRRNNNSDVSNTLYTREKMQEFLQMICDSIPNLLLFNQNLHEFKMFHLANEDQPPNVSLLFETYKVKRLIKAENLSQYNASLLKEVKDRKVANTLGSQQVRMLEKVTIHVSNKAKNQTNDCNWLISWSTGIRDDTLRMTREENGAVPIGAVAVPIEKRESDMHPISLKDLPNGFYKKGHYFVFLPVPINHNYPFHINGSFAVTNDRRSMKAKTGDDNEERYDNWNKLLLGDSVVESLVYLLENIKEICSCEVYKLWPLQQPEDSISDILRLFFYKKAIQSPGNKIYSAKGLQVDISECTFIETRLKENNLGSNVVDLVLKSKYGCRFVDLPKQLYKQIENADKDIVHSKTIHKSTFIVECLLPKLPSLADMFSAQVRDKLIKFAINVEDYTVLELVKEVECVPTKPDGKLRLIKDVVDSRSNIADLFEDSDERFPCEEFLDTTTRDKLRTLGMMYYVIQNCDVLDRLRSIPALTEQCFECGFERCCSILKYFEKNFEHHKGIMKEISDIEFLPVRIQPCSWYKSTVYQPPPSDTCQRHHNTAIHSHEVNICDLRGTNNADDKSHKKEIMCSPKVLHSFEHVNLLGSVALLIDCKAIPKLANVFGWLEHPKIDVVLQHMANIVKHYQSSCKAKFLDMTIQVYGYLSEQPDTTQVRETIEEVFKTVGQCFIWSGDGFVSASKVFVEQQQEDIDLKPYLIPLPSELSHLKSFFLSLGCFNSIDLQAYINVLEQLKNSCDKKANTMHPVSINSLAVKILNKLVHDHQDIIHQPEYTIYVPVQTENADERLFGKLSECVYCEGEHMMDQDVDESDQDLMIVHKDIPQSTISALGIPSLTQKLFSSSDAMEQWGQEEPLTRRLKTILEEGYVDGFSIPKELFQNADDAGATKMWMLYDERENQDCKKNLLSAGMSEWQGPALWVYNDAKFTEEDFKNLTKLSGATKESDPCTIGKFGLGFCAVYNLTDVPSLISGENIVIFDPHMKYLGSALPGKSPGLRVNLSKVQHGTFEKKINNQFKPAEGVFGCSLFSEQREHFEGTLFRFPLRSKPSDISSKPYTHQEMDTLIKITKEYAANLLLFNMNVEEVKIFHLPKSELNPSTATLIFEASKNVQNIVPGNLTCGRSSVLKDAFNSKENKTLEFNQLKVVDSINISRKVFDGSEENNHSVTNWLVSWATGMQKSTLELAYEKAGAIPVSAVAVPFRAKNSLYYIEELKDLQTGFYKESHLYCFLPLPIKHALPYHINCPFLVSSDRRSLSIATEDDSSSTSQNWNECILKDCVVEALLLLFNTMDGDRLKMQQSFQSFSLWPLSTSNELLNKMVPMFYDKVITEDGHRPFRKAGVWYNITQCRFMDPELKGNQSLGNFAFQIYSSYLNDGVAIDIPDDYYRHLFNAGRGLVLQQTATKEDFILMFLFPYLLDIKSNYGLDCVTEFIKYAIHLNQSTVDDNMKEIECIPSKPNCNLKYIRDTVDHDSSIARLFDENDECFVIDRFCDETTRRRLKEMGMLYEVMTDQDVQKCVLSVQRLHDRCSHCAIERCSNLLLYLETHFEHHRDILGELKNLKFLPTIHFNKSDNITTVIKPSMCDKHVLARYDLESAVVNYEKNIFMKEKDSDNYTTLVSPKDVLSLVFKTVIGSVNPVIPCAKMEKIPDEFGWTSSPDIGNVVRHLKHISEEFTNSRKSLFLEMIVDIYRYLEEQHNLDGVKEALSESFADKQNRYIWYGDGFVSPAAIVIEQSEEDIDLKPYLRPLPADLKELAPFFERLGCFSSIDANVYLKILEDIKTDSEQDKQIINVTTVRRVTVNILNILRNKYLETIHQSSRQVFFPIHTSDNTLALKRSDECVFCDSQWLNESDLFSEEDDIMFVHSDISNSTAEALGVSSITDKVFSSADAMEDWGQEEPLTVRLKSIISEGYVDGFSIAKELFQNADDARASKLWILYDKRENDNLKKNLLDEEMAKWQGPAIWVYNDAEFTEDDFNNITKLNGATKSSDSCTIGKFGLGFCAVYNITDLPSFISGESVVVFDPHMKHLGRVRQGKSPGLRINVSKIKNKGMLSKINSQFQPYENVFGCRLVSKEKSSFKGTLFRLPLRKEASDISEKICTNQEIMKLLEKTIDSAANMFLFNMHVKEIKIYLLDENKTDPSSATLLFDAYKDVKNIMSFGIPIETESMLHEVTNRKRNKILEEEPLKVIQQVHVTREDFTLEHSEKSSVNWIVSWATGQSDETLRKTYEENGAIPLGSVAVPYRIDNNILDICPMHELPTGFYRTPHFFFFLPLPIEHTFPFHINGQFSVSSDRRRLRSMSDDDFDSKHEEWNKCLLGDATVEACLYLLEMMKNLQPSPEYRFYDLWPLFDKVPMLSVFPQNFYSKILNQKAQVFVCENGNDSCDREWLDISACTFLDPDLQKGPNRQKAVFDGEKTRSFAFSVLKTFVLSKAIDLPLRYHECLAKSDNEVMDLKTVSAETFILSYLLPNTKDFKGCISKSERNLLLEFSILLRSNTVDVKLQETCCIPTKPDEDLRHIKETVDPEAFFSTLFTPEEGYFPIEAFLRSEIKSRLKELGMMFDSLLDTIVVEKAESVSQLEQTCTNCAKERCEKVLNYLKKKGLYDKNTYTVLQQCVFLPVQEKTQNWPAEWSTIIVYSEGSETQCETHDSSSLVTGSLRKPTEVFNQKCKDLVGCVSPVIDLEILEDATELCRMLGIRDTENDIEATAIVTKHLIKFAETADKSLLEDIADVVKQIYRYLEKKCDKSSEKTAISEDLIKHCVIWVNGFFANSAKCALKEAKDCPPYIFTLKDNTIRYCTNLCDTLEIKKDFDPKMIAKELNNLLSRFGEEPLEDDDLKRSLTLLEVLFDCMKREKTKMYDMFDENLKAIYIPDEDCVLRKSTTLCFNDYDGIEKSDTMVYVHDRVSPKVAKAFGVKPKKIQNLEDISDDIEDFYQEEPLTTRIKNLLEGYPCDASVFKEMLQNADDAGATEVHILFDTLTHPTSNVFDKKFKPLQGPAVLIYNNKCFTVDDLKGIQNLGNSTKRGDPSKTGRYGVGFNAVYNITDAPSFLTFGPEVENGETLCFFDPNAKYIPKVSPRKPGKRYKNTKSIYDHHSDVIQGYHKEDLNKNEEGTIFRLPIRSKQMAKMSKIKENEITTDEVSRMLYDLKSELQNMLIFLKKLKKVSVSSCDKSSGAVITEYTIECKMSEEDEAKKNVFFQHFMATAKQVKSKSTLSFDVDQKTTNYTVTVFENSSQIAFYNIVQVFGFGIGVPDLLRKNISNGNIQLLPYGGVALPLKHKKNPKNLKNDSKVFCFLPLPIDTGLPVNIQGFFALSDETRRSLWISNETNCYKTLWNKFIIENVITPGYIELLDILKSQLVTKFEKKSPKVTHFEREAQTFFSAFPCMVGTGDFYWAYLAKCVCRLLVKENICFLPILHQNVEDQKANLESIEWTSVYTDSHQFPAYVQEQLGALEQVDSSTVLNKLTPIGVKVYTRYAVLKKLGMKIVSVPKQIKKAFSDADVGIPELSGIDVIDFLCSSKSKFEDRCSLKIDVPVTESPLKSIENCKILLEYCEHYDHVYCLFGQIPILVSQKGTLKMIENSYMYTSSFSTFFKDKLDLFLNASLLRLFKSNKTGGALKQFTISDFVSHLMESEFSTLAEGPLVNWSKDFPTAPWIIMFWDFFWRDIHLHAKSGKEVQSKIDEKLSVVRSVSLLPIIEHQSVAEVCVNLVPVAEIDSLIFLDSFKGDMLRRAFRKMWIPELDTSCFQASKYIDYLLHQLPRFEHPEKVLGSLIKNLKKVKDAEMSKEECICVLEYLLRSLGTQCLADNMGLIRQLPLFITHDGQRVDIASFETVVVVPDALPKGLDFLTQQKYIVLLKRFDIYQGFTRELLLQDMSIGELYVRHIIPNYDKMDHQIFYEHVKFIHKQYKKREFSKNEITNVIALLSNTPFIKSTQGTFLTVSIFFSSHSIEFKTFCNDAEFLPQMFRGENYLEFFSMLGLITIMNLTLFERFARKTAELERSDETLENKSKVLSESLVRMPIEFFSTSNLSTLAEIKFLLPKTVSKQLLDICPQYCPNQRICYARSVVPSKSKLCWSTSSLLPSYAIPYLHKERECFCGALKVSVNPDTKDFIMHCKNVGSSIHSKLSTGNKVEVDMLKELMHALYTEMERLRVTSVDNTLFDPLKEITVVFFPKKNQIHTANSVVIECDRDEEIPPFLNKCSPDFVQFSELFLCLGSFDSPTIDSYVMVLNCIKTKCGNNELLPPEKDFTKRGITNLVKVLRYSKDKTVHCQDLFIPSDDWRMEKSETLILCNNKYIKKRIGKKLSLKFFVGFEIFEIKEDIGIAMFLKLAPSLCPQLLTDLIGEEIMLEDIKFQDNDDSRQLEHYLHSDLFAGGLVRLAKHASRKSQSKWTQENEDICLNLLRGTSVRNVASMKTILILKKENRKHIEGTSRPKAVHIQQDQDSLKVYVNTKGKRWFNEFKKEFAIHMNEALKSCFKDRNFVLLVEIIEAKDNPETISEILDKNHIDHYSLVQQTHCGVFPKPGDFVPEEFHEYLDNSVGIIHEYDYRYIAYEVEDPLIEDMSDSIPTYVYAEIKRRIGSDSNVPLLQMYEVDIGEDDLVQVPAFKLYVFRRKETKTKTEECVLFDGASNENTDEASASADSSTPGRQNSMKEVRKEIRETLTEAWKKNENERRHIVKRLMLKWHPDKNPDNVDFCTEVFQFIQQCLRLLERGSKLTEDDDSDNEDGSSRRNTNTHSDFGTGGFWGTFYDSFDRRNRNRRRNTDWGNSSGSFFGSSAWSNPFVYKREAQRWQRQAQSDLGSAQECFRGHPNPAYNWICYKCHQAVEKALKAAWYAKDANSVRRFKYSHDIAVIAIGLSSSIRSLVSELLGITGASRKMRYPSEHYGDAIPVDNYSRHNAEGSCRVTEDLLREVANTYNL